jgi:hypothetical protein
VHGLQRLAHRAQRLEDGALALRPRLALGLVVALLLDQVAVAGPVLLDLLLEALDRRHGRREVGLQARAGLLPCARSSDIAAASPPAPRPAAPGGGPR